MAVITDAIIFLQELGFWDVALPFMLVFTLVFAILEKTKIFGTEKGRTKRHINAMFAFIIAFLVLISVSVLEIINIVAQYMVVVIVAVMMIAIFLGLMGYKGFGKNLALVVGIVVIGGLALYLLGYFNVLDFNALRRYLEGPIIALLILLLLVWFILRPVPEAEKLPERPEGEPST